MINEQELSDAVDRLREGEQVLGVNSDHVIDAIYSSPANTGKLLYLLHENDSEAAQEYFERKFNEAATGLLRQAKENELTHRAELNEIEAFAERNNVRVERACVMLGKPVNRYSQLKGE